MLVGGNRKEWKKELKRSKKVKQTKEPEGISLEANLNVILINIGHPSNRKFFFLLYLLAVISDI